MPQNHLDIDWAKPRDFLLAIEAKIQQANQADQRHMQLQEAYDDRGLTEDDPRGLGEIDAAGQHSSQLWDTLDQLTTQAGMELVGGGESGDDYEPSLSQMQAWLVEYQQAAQDGGANRQQLAEYMTDVVQPNLQKLLGHCGIPLFW